MSKYDPLTTYKGHFTTEPDLQIKLPLKKHNKTKQKLEKKGYKKNKIRLRNK